MLSHTPRQHGIDMQVTSHTLRIVLRLVVRATAAGHDFEIRKTGKTVPDLLGKTVAEVVYLGVVACVRKRHHGERLNSRIFGPRSTYVAGVEPKQRASHDQRCKGAARGVGPVAEWVDHSLLPRQLWRLLRSRLIPIDRPDESIPATLDRLDEAGSVGSVAERLSQPFDSVVYPPIEIHEGARRPNPLA